VFEDAAIASALHTYVLESAPVLALRLDAADRVTAANTEAGRVLRDGGRGRAFADLLVAFTRPANVPALLRQTGVIHRLTLDTAVGVPETLDFRFFSLPNGTLAVASLDFREQQALRGQVLRLNGELSNLTRQLHQANAELRELNELKNRFLGMAAHDLRKPVGLIMTYSEFVLDEAGPQLTPEHREFLRTCLTAATGMRQVIDDFLDLSVIESGQLRLNRAPASAREILAGALPVARLLAEKKKITLQVEPADDARRLPVDASKLQQVLLNLLGNAIEHSEPGRCVELTARWVERQLVFAVRDEGAGIALEDQARLFAAYGRAGSKKTAGESSTGLGLSIARLIVEAHGGRIWVESTPGHGASFLFALPDQPPEPR
jgi:signal transduction histidine kinase